MVGWMSMARVRPPMFEGPSSDQVPSDAPGAAVMLGRVRLVAEENCSIWLAALIADRYQEGSSAVAPCGSRTERKYLVAASGSPSRSWDSRSRLSKERGGRTWRGFPFEKNQEALIVTAISARIVAYFLVMLQCSGCSEYTGEQGLSN